MSDRIVTFEGGALTVRCPHCEEEFEIRKRGDKLVTFAELKPKSKPAATPEKPDDKGKSEIEPKEPDTLEKIINWLDK